MKGSNVHCHVKAGAKPKDGAKTIVEFIVISITKAFRTNVQSAALMLTVHAPKFAGLCIDGPGGVLYDSSILLFSSTVGSSTYASVQTAKRSFGFFKRFTPCIHSQNPSVALQAAKLIVILLKKIQKRIRDRKQSGMMPSSKSAPVIGILTTLSAVNQRSRALVKVVVLGMQLVRNWQNIKVTKKLCQTTPRRSKVESTNTFRKCTT